MVSITLSVPKELKEKMERFQEINWSGYVRSSIQKKVDSMIWKEEMIEKLKGEEEFDEWAVQLGRKVKKKAFGKIRRKEGL